MSEPADVGDPVRRAADALERIACEERAGIWIETFCEDRVLDAARAVATRRAAGDTLPLAGVTLAVKGNIDVAGTRTTAGCPTYGAVPDRSAASIRALEAAGAITMGVTNLDQFATGLVGTRSPYGVCPNAHWDGLVSGGSSSGSAVAVATGMVDVGVGTDTAGSGRVPAAANGIVGLKPTRGRISTAGVVPACASLDCIAVLARTVDAAAAVAAVASTTSPDPEDPWTRRDPRRSRSDQPLRIGLPDAARLDFDGDDSSRERFGHAAGWIAEVAGPTCDVDLAALVAAGRMLYDGAFVAERYAAVGQFVDAHRAEVDPTVGSIISAAGELPAWRLAADQTELQRHRAIADALFRRLDVVVVPSVPRLPTVEEVAADPIGVNSMLGTYTNFVNLLDLCALTIPVPGTGSDQHPPTSITLIASAWNDQVLIELGRSLMAGSDATPTPRGTSATHRTG